MMHAACPEWAVRLIDLLDRQRGLYLQLQGLSDQQGRIIAEPRPDVSELVLLLGRRQSLIDQLSGLNGRIEPFRRDWPGLWRSLDSIWRSRIRGLIDDVQGLLEAIAGQDEKDRASLWAQRQRLIPGAVRPGYVRHE